MKRSIFFCLFILSIYTMLYAQDSIPVTDTLNNAVAGVADISGNKSVNEQAAAAYNDRDYRQAIEILEKEKKEQMAKGLESPALYYNLGNAYFRVNDLAHARLYYERALLLDPGDRDIRHNIDYLSTKIEDKILVADTFFLNIWFRAVQNLFSSNAWATIAVICFILFMACLVAFFFSRHIAIKKAAFYAGIATLVIVIFANVFAFGQKGKIEKRETAVIMVGSVTILGSPDINSKELFTLHSGTKVFITKEDRNWYEIEIDNGSVGWIQKDKLEVI